MQNEAEDSKGEGWWWNIIIIMKPHERDFLISFLILLFSDGTKEKVEDVENAGGES